MKQQIENRIKQAQDILGIKFPKNLFDFISNLEKPEVKFRDEEWLFWIVTDKENDINDNSIISNSKYFKQEWKLDGLVFADNGIGDSLVLLPNENSTDLLETIFVMMHETAEIKVFAENLEALFKYGPDDYFWSNQYYVKLEDDKLVKWNEEERPIDENSEPDFFGESYELRSLIDDMIDDEKTEKTSEIIEGLEKLIDCNEESHKAWALNKLSDIYLKGFGPIPGNMIKALEYNQQAMEMNSHKAFSNRAACYFFGLGIDKDLDKALEFARKANDLSKSNLFADIIATKEGGGMYDNLVEMIEKEMRKKKK